MRAQRAKYTRRNITCNSLTSQTLLNGYHRRINGGGGSNILNLDNASHRFVGQTVADREGKALDGLTPAGFLLKRWDTDGNGTLSYDELQK